MSAPDLEINPTRAYPACEPWCELGNDNHVFENEDYCQRAVGHTVWAQTSDDTAYEVDCSRANLLVPIGASNAEHRRASNHRDVVRAYLSPHGDPDNHWPTLTLFFQSSAARSLAAVLIRSADLAEGIAR